jgi:hypothetical protein
MSRTTGQSETSKRPQSPQHCQKFARSNPVLRGTTQSAAGLETHRGGDRGGASTDGGKRPNLRDPSSWVEDELRETMVRLVADRTEDRADSQLDASAIHTALLRWRGSKSDWPFAELTLEVGDVAGVGLGLGFRLGDV